MGHKTHELSIQCSESIGTKSKIHFEWEFSFLNNDSVIAIVKASEKESRRTILVLRQINN